MLSRRATFATLFPGARATSASRSFAMICSALSRFRAIPAPFATPILALDLDHFSGGRSQRLQRFAAPTAQCVTDVHIGEQRRRVSEAMVDRQQLPHRGGEHVCGVALPLRQRLPGIVQVLALRQLRDLGPPRLAAGGRLRPPRSIVAATSVAGDRARPSTGRVRALGRCADRSPRRRRRARSLPAPPRRAAAQTATSSAGCGRPSLASLAEATERAFGPAQLLVNNAGVMTRADLDDSDDGDWTWTLGVNLLGVVEGVRTFLPQLRTHAPNAHIMNTGSMAGLAPRVDAGAGAYSASKAAVVVYSEVLRQELSGEGIGVTVLCPGTVSTRIFDAERNRPASLGEGHRVRVPVRVAQAMTADPVAAAVLDAIATNEPFIFTHDDSRGRIEARFAHIADSLDAADVRVDGGA